MPDAEAAPEHFQYIALRNTKSRTMERPAREAARKIAACRGGLLPDAPAGSGGAAGADLLRPGTRRPCRL